MERARKGLLESPPAEMTVRQAAEFLDVSPSFVLKLIKQKKLPCRLVGKHRRVPTIGLRSIKESMFQEARSAADEIAATSQALGLYDFEPPPKKR